MIISASRRTDIPAFYSPWLMNRLEAGTVGTRNPFNPAQVRTLSLRPEDVDCLVFWSKNPAPMLPALDRLDALGYAYYFQFTLTPYGPDLEPRLPPKDALAETFRRLGERLGPHRVIWRYDPIVLNDLWTVERHIRSFECLCTALSGCTRQVVISFVDLYKKVRAKAIRPIAEPEMVALAQALGAIGAEHGLRVSACCEALELSPYGIGRAACIDRSLIQAIGGRGVSARVDSGQRPGCGCCQSVDIGAYNTCRHGCVYCYASYSPASIARSCARHDPMGEWLLEP